MKDYAIYQGNNNIGGSKDATQEAFQLQLISDGHIWMDMILSRNKTSHTYNEETAEDIYSKILYKYYPAFLEFQKIMEAVKNKEWNKFLPMENTGLNQEEIDNRRAVFSKYSPVEKVMLYGSRAKDTFWRASDIDLVLVGENVDLDTQNRIELDLDDLYMPYKIDVAIFHKINNPDLIEHIQRVGKTLYNQSSTKAGSTD